MTTIPPFSPMNAPTSTAPVGPTGTWGVAAPEAGSLASADGGMGSRIANVRLGDSWHHVASGSDYGRIFGNQSYVKDLGDPQMLSLIQEVLAKAPELQGTSLATNAQQGRVTKEDIQTLQKFLESKGCSVGSTGVDGKYGPRTHKALEGFLSGRGSEAPRPESPQGEVPRSEAPTAPRGRRHLRPQAPGEEPQGPRDPGFQTVPYRVPTELPRTIET